MRLDEKKTCLTKYVGAGTYNLGSVPVDVYLSSCCPPNSSLSYAVSNSNITLRLSHFFSIVMNLAEIREDPTLPLRKAGRGDEISNAIDPSHQAVSMSDLSLPSANCAAYGPDSPHEVYQACCMFPPIERYDVGDPAANRAQVLSSALKH